MKCFKPFWAKNICPKNIWPKKTFGRKNIWPKKHLAEKTFGRHAASVDKMFGRRNVFLTLLVDEQLINWATSLFLQYVCIPKAAAGNPN
jgi:hypothetical protein